ncbi:Peptidyl-prolyl cis-trans isomerase CYP19-2 [Striga hermonthica]|uniref:Peptidyl-prolyl cis-trans isomerase n=1 Tax=Striga hermonthica TaxID=68872 RepID=A0A9N7N901_STRHE|nr:Peptidyl-prolyl cis-trans isomerase CYP19-2 [Striga hermonthica]
MKNSAARNLYVGEEGRQPSGRPTFAAEDGAGRKTAENFCAICISEKGVGKSGKPFHHKLSSFHCVIPDFICQSGDFTASNGTGGESTCDAKFGDKNIVRSTPGPVDGECRAGDKRHVIIICTTRTKWLDDKHVVFGQVVEDYDVLKMVENVGSGSRRTSRPVVIADWTNSRFDGCMSFNLMFVGYCFITT